MRLVTIADSYSSKRHCKSTPQEAEKLTMRRIPKLVFALLSMAVLVIAVVVVWILSTINECSELQQVPSVPLYPGSILVEYRESSRPREDYSLLVAMIAGSRNQVRLVSVEYSAEASAQDIIDFYAAQAATCRSVEGSLRVMCHRYMETPYGSYSVYIDRDLVPQVFTIEIRWYYCGSIEDV